MSTLTADNFTNWYSARVRRSKGRFPAATTLRTKESRVRTLLRLAGASDLEAMADIMADRLSLVAVIDNVHATLSPNSAVQLVQTLRELGDWYVAAGRLQHVKMERDDWPRRVENTRPMEVYSDAEVETLIACSRGRSLRWWAFLTTLADTGRRVGEVLGVQWDHFKLESDPPHIDLKHTKNGTQQYVPLTRRLCEEVYTPANVERLRRGDDLRTNTKRDTERYPFPWVYATANDRMRSFCEAVGVEYRGFHVFRHTRATSLIAKGVPLTAVASLLGHASVATTEKIYAHATSLDFVRFIDG